MTANFNFNIFNSVETVTILWNEIVLWKVHIEQFYKTVIVDRKSITQKLE